MSDFYFRTWDANGVLTFGSNDRLGRILGRIDVIGANNNGTFNDPAMLNGDPFAFFFQMELDLHGWHVSPPQVGKL